MSENKIIIDTKGGPVINGGTFSNIQFVAQQNVVYNAEQKCANTSEDIDEATVVMDNMPDDTENILVQDIPQSVKSCFYFANDFVRENIDAIIKQFYMNKHTNLAMIEVALFDHGQLRQRNSHRLFVNALVDWEILPNNVDVGKICSGMATKLKNIPTEGYMSWDSTYTNERKLCQGIGKKLPESMKYNR